MRNVYSGKSRIGVILTLLVALLAGFNLSAQVIHGTATPTLVNGTLTYRDPGDAANYPINQAAVVHRFLPDPCVPAGRVRVVFTQFALENNACPNPTDFLQVRRSDGAAITTLSANGRLSMCAGETPVLNTTVFESNLADGIIEFVFTSDAAGVAAGWQATVTTVPGNCADPLLTAYDARLEPLNGLTGDTVLVCGNGTGTTADAEFTVIIDDLYVCGTNPASQQAISTATINWGDGSPAQAGTITAGANLDEQNISFPVHSFTKGFLRTITVTLTDNYGCTRTLTRRIAIYNFAYTGTLDRQICQGLSATLNAAYTITPNVPVADIDSTIWRGPKVGSPTNALDSVYAKNVLNLGIAANTLPVGQYDFSFEVYTSTPTSCSYSQVVRLGINPKPDAGEIGPLSPLVTCQDGPAIDLNNLVIAPVPVPNGQSGVWTSKNGQVPNATITAGSQVLPQDLVDASGTFGNFRFVYTAMTACPDRDSVEVVVTVARKPFPGQGPGGPVEYCQSERNVRLLDTLNEGGMNADAGGTWRINGVVVTGDTIVGDRLDAAALNEGAYTITYTVTSATCGDQTSSLDVIIRATPFVNADTTIFRCEGEPEFDMRDFISMNNADKNGNIRELSTGVTATSTRVNPGTPTVAGGFVNPFFNPGAEPVSGTFVFEYVNNRNVPPCEQKTFVLTVVYQNKPDAGGDEDITACSNEIINLTTTQTAPGNTSVMWFGPNDAVTPITDPTAVDISALGGTVATFTAIDFTNSPACVSDTAVITIDISQFMAVGNPPADSIFVCETDPAFMPYNRLLGVKDINGKSSLAPTAPLTGTTHTATFTPSAAIANQSFVYTYAFDANGACPAIDTSYVIVVTPKPNAGLDNTTIADATQACSIDATFDLKPLLSGDNGVNGPATNPYIQFEFKLSDGTTPAYLDPATGIVTIAATPLMAGTYNFIYIVKNTRVGCIPDTAKLILRVNRVPNAGSDNFIITCNDGPSVTLFPKVAPADTDVPAEMRDGIFTGTGVQNGNNVPAATFNPAGLPSATDSILYVVSVPKCPNDTAKIMTFISKKPEAGTAIVPSMGVCENDSMFDLYTLLNGTFDRGGRWTITLGGNWDPNINNEINVAGRLNYFNETPTDTNIFDVKRFIAYVNGTSTPTFTDTHPPVFKFKYTVCDTNRFVYNGLSLTPPPACPCAETSVDLEVSQFFTAVQRTQTVFNVCQADNVNLNQLILSSYGYRKNQLPPDPITDVFRWTITPDLNPSLMENDSVFTAARTNPATTYTATLVRESEGCTYNPQISATIRITKIPSAGAPGQVTVCEDVTAPLDLRTVLINPDLNGTSTLSINSATPGTGAFSPPSNTFLPNLAGPGIYDFDYTVVASPGCGSNATSTARVIVERRPFPGLDVSKTICRGEGPIFLKDLLDVGADQSGTFVLGANSGGLTGNTYAGATFSSTSGQAINTFDYTVKKVGCQDAVATITLTLADTVSAGMQNLGDTSFCSTNGPINLVSLLGAGTSSGGSFSPISTPGLSGITFTPLPVNIGSTLLTYTVSSNADICSNPTRTSQIILNIEKAPTAGTDGVIDICKESGLLNLFNVISGSRDGNGKWESNPPGLITLGGSNSELLNPAQLSIVEGNNYTFNYTVEGKVCPDDISTATVRVIPKFRTGNPKPAFDTVCANVGTYDLFSRIGVNNVDFNRGGTWRDRNGNGVPSLITVSTYANLQQPVAFTYSAPISGVQCAESSDTVYLTISPVPNAGTNGSLNICADAGAINLFSAISGFQAGGTWSYDPSNLAAKNQGLVGNIFNLGAVAPASQRDGAFKFIYVVKAPGCSNDTSFVTVNVRQKAYLGAATQNVVVCNTGDQIDLLKLLKQETGVTTPVDLTGTFAALDPAVGNSGALIGTFFNTSLVTSSANPYRFTYTVNTTGCVANKINLNVTLLDGGRDTTLTICKSTPEINLFDLVGAGNTTGKWRFVGLNPGAALIGDRAFDASKATVGATYTLELRETNFDPLFACAPRVTITIADSLSINNLSFIVTPPTYRVSFNILGGLAPYTVLDEVNGTSQSVASSTALYTSDAINNESAYNFSISDKAGCIVLKVKGADLGDSDKDGTLNVVDLDDDNDGVPDILESLGFDASADHNDNGVPNFRDPAFCSDNGGLMNGAQVCELFDFDGDGIINQFDLDSDNDGIFDIYEVFGVAAVNVLDKTPLDGIVDNVADNAPFKDGWRDVAQQAYAIGIVRNTDNMLDLFGKPSYDFLDIDSDDDKIGDAVEAGANPKNPANTDQLPGYVNGDLLEDYRDLDSDNDSIYDVFEAGISLLAAADTDGDGKFDYIDLDSDGDLIPDAVEARIAGVVGSAPINSDNDAMADFRDLDSDNDAIADRIEAGANPSAPVNTDFATTSDNLPDYIDTDSDEDSILDLVEGGGGTTPINSDNDTMADYIDLDSDNDGLSDALEASYATAAPSTPQLPRDSDGNGTFDFREIDSDADGIMDSVEAGIDFIMPADFDADGLFNFQDADSDDDRISDKAEGFATPAQKASQMLSDVDEDGIPDYQDDDTDGDNILDKDEATAETFDPNNPSIYDNPQDTDADGTADFRDLDSDGDKVTDKIEGVADCDNDGIRNFQDAGDNCTFLVDVPQGFSPNNDGKNDFFVVPDISEYPGNKLTIFNRWGAVVFEQSDYDNKWNGLSKENQEELPAGTYFYLLDLGLGQDAIKGYVYINR